MANSHIKYRCSRCSAPTPREALLARRVQFVTLGRAGRIIKSRTTDWLCVGCVLLDPAWQRDKLAESPGMEDTRMNQHAEV